MRRYFCFLAKAYHYSSVQQTVKEDVALLKASPFIQKDIQIVGLVYDTNTGILTEVKEHESEL